MRWSRIKQQSKEARSPVRRPPARDPSERSRQLSCQKGAANNSAAPHEADKEEGKGGWVSGIEESWGRFVLYERLGLGLGREASQTRKEAKQFRFACLFVVSCRR
jgi:hypothetical protein